MGGWLRFTATSFGLPDHFRPDEEIVVGRALGFDKGWNPHYAIYPAAHLYFLHAVLRSYAMLTAGAGNFHAIYDRDHEALAFLLARRVSAAMGTATIPAIYLAAEPAFGPATALASAAIIAFSDLHVRESKFAKLQVPAGFWLTLAILMMLRIAYRGRWSDYAGAGFFCGLAAATHYLAGTIAIGVLGAHFEARYRENRALQRALGDARIYLAGSIAILTFLCATPYLVLDRVQTLHDYTYLRERSLTGYAGALPTGYGYRWSWLLFEAMPHSFGIGLQILLLVSLVWAIVRSRPGTLGLLAYIAVDFFSMTSGREPQLEYRWLLNSVLAMALLAGVFAADLTAFASARLGTRRGISLAVAVYALLLAPSLIRDLQLNRLLLRTDTRTLARQWIVDHIPRGTAIAVTHSGMPYGKPQLPAGSWPPELYTFVPIKDLDSLRVQNVSWILSDSFPPLSLWSRGLSDAALAVLNSDATLVLDINPIREGVPTPVFDPNDAFYVPFQRISSMERPGPRIRIWKLK